jgi:hypothetical protein
MGKLPSLLPHIALGNGTYSGDARPYMENKNKPLWDDFNSLIEQAVVHQKASLYTDLNEEMKWALAVTAFDETGEHCKSNASRRAHDRRALTGEAGNASRRKVIVEATARSLEWASAWRTQDESGPTFSRVIRTNFGDRMAKIFRENSDSLDVTSVYNDAVIGDWQHIR